MSTADEQLRQLDQRAAAAGRDLHARAADRPAPAFDPDRAAVTALPTARPNPRGRLLAVAAVVLVAAAIAGLLVAQSGDDGDDKAKVISTDPRPFVAGRLPEGLQLAGAGEITNEQARASTGDDGPASLYGPDEEDPRLLIGTMPAPELTDSDLDPVDLGSGRTGYVYDEVGLGKHAVLAVDDDQAFVIASSSLETDRLLDLAGEVSVDGSGAIDLGGSDLPDGWRPLGDAPSLSGFGNPILSTVDPSAVGHYVLYLQDPPDALGTDGTTLTVWSTPGEDRLVYAGAVTADSTKRTTVRGHDALITNSTITMQDGPVTTRSVTWIERPGELVRVSGYGFDEAELLATAEGVEPVGPAAWKDLLERSQLGEFDSGGTDAPTTVVGEGRFDDGSRWKLEASASEDPSFPDPTVHLSVALAEPDDSSSTFSGTGSALGGSEARGFLSVETESTGGKTFTGALIGPDVARVAVLGPDGEVLDEPAIAEGGGFRGVAVLVPTDGATLVAYAADGTEIAREDLRAVDDGSSSSGSSSSSSGSSSDSGPSETTVVVGPGN